MKSLKDNMWFVLLAVLGFYVLSPFLLGPFVPAIRPPNLIGLSIENIRPSEDGYSVEFTLRLRNKGAYPISLSDLRWTSGGPELLELGEYGYPISGSKFALTATFLLPFQSLVFRCVVTYPLASILEIIFIKGRYGTDYKIREVDVSISGKVALFCIPFVAMDFMTYAEEKVAATLATHTTAYTISGPDFLGATGGILLFTVAVIAVILVVAAFGIRGKARTPTKKEEIPTKPSVQDLKPSLEARGCLASITRILKKSIPFILMSWGLWIMTRMWVFDFQIYFTLLILGVMAIDELMRKE